MNIKSMLQHVAVLGAAGKMGRGISLLWAQTLAHDFLSNENHHGEKKLSKITLIDISPNALSELNEYLESNLEKWARRNKDQVAKLYQLQSDISAKDLESKISQYILDVRKFIRYATSIEGAEEATLVIEAATEDEQLKKKILNDVSKIASPDAFYFTNTSSIPIAELEKIGENKFKGRIMGLHYYNPPPVQKVVEIVHTESTDQNLIELAHIIGNLQNKNLLPANDIAGFIGNGYFMREGLFALNEAKDLELHHNLKFHEAVYAVNKIYQDFLVRPMGMFQLIDYVGVDVFQLILRVMNNYLRDNGHILYSALIDAYRERNVAGGQLKDGAQRDGIFQYNLKGEITGVYCLELNNYVSVSKIEERIKPLLGNLPKSHSPWSLLRKDKDLQTRIDTYLAELNEMAANNHLGATLALKYLTKCREISQYLKDSGVVDNLEYVKTDLRDGFQHIIL